MGGHPAPREGWPLAPEPIRWADGSRQHEGERAAAQRRREGRRAPPHRKRRVGEDALASNGPSIRGLEERDRRSVLGGKPGDPGEGCRWVDATAATRPVERTRGGHLFRCRCLNGGPLKDANVDGEGNGLECWETRPAGRTGPFSWVTDRAVTAAHADPLRRAGRVRGRIENEPFNPLKNPGDGWVPPFGHGQPPRVETVARLVRGVPPPGRGDGVPGHRVRAPPA